jgi:hypothetical protein
MRQLLLFFVIIFGSCLYPATANPVINFPGVQCGKYEKPIKNVLGLTKCIPIQVVAMVSLCHLQLHSLNFKELPTMCPSPASFLQFVLPAGALCWNIATKMLATNNEKFTDMITFTAKYARNISQLKLGPT